MADDAEQKRLDLVHNERTKLTATWFNNVGVGCVIAGFLAPSLQAVTAADPKPAWIIAAFGGWFVIGVILNLAGRNILKGLKP